MTDLQSFFECYFSVFTEFLSYPNMRRFTLTPQSRKSIKLNSTSLKPIPFPRMSIMNDELSSKESRNTRDKAYKAACIENVIKFLMENAYEGQFSQKILMNPSVKEFQSIFKFIYSFIDSTPFQKFEEDVVNILKLLKYPYTSEITKSQLSAATPHTWPVLLSMISWLVDLVNKASSNDTQTTNIEIEFFDFTCEGYLKFMEGEDDSYLDEQFMEKIKLLHSKETLEIENQRKELEVIMSELENLKSKFDDLSRLENKKRKINDDLNSLILNDKQLEIKKAKYISSIEKIIEEITVIETQIEELIQIKNELLVQINSQTINPQDIKDLNIEKVELFKQLEKLKPEREELSRALKQIEQKINEKADLIEKVTSEINSIRTGLEMDKNGITVSVIVEMEKELSNKRESLVNYEISLATLEDKHKEKETHFQDLEEQYSHLNSKLQTIGSIYLEKKEIAERSQQKNRNEIDRLENELLKLKLESDSIYLKSEKDYSESKIKLDVLNSFIVKEKEEISRMVWDFYNNADSILKSFETVEKELKRTMHN